MKILLLIMSLYNNKSNIIFTFKVKILNYIFKSFKIDFI